MLFDCTQPRYYGNVAYDLMKLDAIQGFGASGCLFVFFLQLPSYEYPKGLWYGSDTYESMDFYMLGIKTQYQHLCEKLKDRPTWPQDGPYIHDLSPTSWSRTRRGDSAAISAGLHSGQSFLAIRGDEHLRDARVGVAIWER